MALARGDRIPPSGCRHVHWATLSFIEQLCIEGLARGVPTLGRSGAPETGVLTALTQAILSVRKVVAERMHGVDIPFERMDELALATRGDLR